jgi:hypothetical protein
MREDPDIALRIIEILCSKLRRTTEQAEEVMFLDLPSRLARALVGPRLRNLPASWRRGPGGANPCCYAQAVSGRGHFLPPSFAAGGDRCTQETGHGDRAGAITSSKREGSNDNSAA